VRPTTAFHYVFGALATLVLAPPVILFSVLGWPNAAYRPVRLWARLLQLISRTRTRAHGLENIPASGSYVVISNHCSHLDGPAIVYALPHPVYIVIKKELARIPLWGQTVVKLGFIVVDRSDSDQARAEMERAVEAVRSGRRVLVFAEGTRSMDGHLQRLKKGGFHLAVEAQVPILPVAVNRSHTLFAKGAPKITPGTVEVHVCRPIPTVGLGVDDIEELIERTREEILEARRKDPDFIEIDDDSHLDPETTTEPVGAQPAARHQPSR
jgi:1-acyl-sn-glycerol-3-phosphate acyltransferase